MTIGLTQYLVVSALVLGLGFFTVVTRRNAVAVLMGVELILNAGMLNLVAFSRFVTGDLGGHMVTLFGIVLAAAEAVVALAIVLQLFRVFHTVDTLESSGLKE